MFTLQVQVEQAGELAVGVECAGPVCVVAGQVPLVLGVGPYGQIQGGLGVVGALGAGGLVGAQAVAVGAVQVGE